MQLRTKCLRGGSITQKGKRMHQQHEGRSAAHSQLDSNSQALAEERQLKESRTRLGKVIAVMSGKGGVGKSTVAVNIAVSLLLRGKRVGLLDVDIHGPSVPTMLGVEGSQLFWDENGIQPVTRDGLKIMSTGFILPSQDEAIIWRGAMKMNAIKQFITDVDWGDLDFLIVDLPPGTGDEPLSLCQLMGRMDGAVIVTTPQKVAEVDVRKSISFCKQLEVPILGIVENMSGFACPKCGEITPILRSGGGRRLAEAMHIPFLGAVPMDPALAEACDNGQPLVQSLADSPTAKVLAEVIQPLLALK